MRQFLLSLMVLAMMTPGLACANIMNHQKASQEQMAKDMPCCPEKAPSQSGTMLMKDCMKIDLQQADSTPVVKKADTVTHDFFAVTLSFAKCGVSSAEKHPVRGPPFDTRLSLGSSPLPVFLMTQRIRI